MDDLIAALQIFRKYAEKDVYAPTHCEHDELRIYPGFGPEGVSEDDIDTLDDLGFHPDPEFADEGAWISYRFGSC